MTDIHGTAARGFDAAAEVYDRGRPGYPDGALDFLIEHLRLTPDSRVLDLGAGTGKMAAHLAYRGIPVVAVEPVEGMRARLHEQLPDVECLGGAAEAIPLPDASVHAVVCAQSFHWFRHDEALAEMHRVLVEHGRLALVWNVRDESVDWVARITEIIRPYEGAGGVRIPRHREGEWRAALDSTELFGLVAATTVPHTQELTPEGVVDRVASTSFIAVLPEADRLAVLDEVRALTGEPPLGGKGRLSFPYVTEVTVYGRAV